MVILYNFWKHTRLHLVCIWNTYHFNMFTTANTSCITILDRVWARFGVSQNRRQKVVNRGALRSCRGAWHSNLTKSPPIYSVSYFNLGAWSFVWGAKPTKAPPTWRRDWGECVNIAAITFSCWHVQLRRFCNTKHSNFMFTTTIFMNIYCRL